jgi:hypothetical protein
LKHALRDRERAEWLGQFPDAIPYVPNEGDTTPAAFRTYAITDTEGYFRFKSPPGAKTSRLDWLEVPMDGFVVAVHNGHAHYFQAKE